MSESRRPARRKITRATYLHPLFLGMPREVTVLVLLLPLLLLLLSSFHWLFLCFAGLFYGTTVPRLRELTQRDPLFLPVFGRSALYELQYPAYTRRRPSRGLA